MAIGHGAKARISAQRARQRRWMQTQMDRATVPACNSCVRTARCWARRRGGVRWWRVRKMKTMMGKSTYKMWSDKGVTLSSIRYGSFE